MRRKDFQPGRRPGGGKRYLLPGGLWILVVVLNILAWKNKAFCDFYVIHIYPLWVNTYSRAMGIFSFSVGEMMVIAGAVLTVAAILLSAVYGAAWIFEKRQDTTQPIGGARADWKHKNRNGIRKFCKGYFVVYGWIFTGVAIVMTLNCFIPYHCSTLEEKYGILCRGTEGGFAEGSSAEEGFVVIDLLSREYTLEELIRLRDYVVIKTNELAELVERDENGNIIYPEDMEGELIACMQDLGGECGQLAGYYPRPKQFTFSGFFSQQKMKGYFFPFSMEVNYNKLMHEINRPATICHEYAHLKGFMYEEEANMIGFLACIHSSDLTFQYSGYLSVLNYIDNEFYKAIGKDKEIYLSHVNISPRVREENIFLEKDAWEKVEARAVISTEVVDKVSDKLSETSMVLNGVEDGTLSYTRVVGLLLHYYDGSPEVEETLLQAQAIPADPETTSETPSKITSVMNTIEVQENTY